MHYYAVANGRQNGIFLNWNDCKTSVIGYKNAIYKKFDIKEDAVHFVKEYSQDDNENNNYKTHQIISFYDLKFINPNYYVYTDGACSNNGRDNAIAGIGIFFGINDDRNVSRKLEGKQTNNIAELTAIVETYNIIEADIINDKKIVIVSDSKYAIRCISSYGEKCHNNNWNENIPNKDLVKTAYELYKNKLNVKFIHINAHTKKRDIHSIGNECADNLAINAIRKGKD